MDTLVRGQATERTYYPALLKLIEAKGGNGVQEVKFNSSPDIIFTFQRRKWILSVKIGETPTILKQAFLQYQRHKNESGIKNGLLLMLPESSRTVSASSDAIEEALRSMRVSVLVDAQPVNDEYRDRTFDAFLDALKSEVCPAIVANSPKSYSLELTLQLLQEQVVEVMESVNLGEEQILKIVTDRDLLTQLGAGHLTKEDSEAVTRFLASYIILSQILFLRILSTSHPDIKAPATPITRARLRRAFESVLEINYRAIFELDVLDALGDSYLRDTFDLVWGLQVEKSPHELPGRLFHKLMPPTIRKLLAAFYTRPQAADLLARLTIQSSTERVFDPACGSGTILVAAYRRKLSLHREEKRKGNPHKRFCEVEIFGSDVMPFAVHLTSANLAAMDVEEPLERSQILYEDSLKLVPGKGEVGGFRTSPLFPISGHAHQLSGKTIEIKVEGIDTVLMNPPFTKVERNIAHFVNMVKYRPVVGGEVGLWGHFLPLANEFLHEGGMIGAVIPINILRGRESERVRHIIFTESYTPLYVLKPTANYAFSEWAEYRDVILVLRKGPAPADHRVKFCLIKDDIGGLTADQITELAGIIQTQAHLRSPSIDVDSHAIGDVRARSVNMMWFCGTSDLYRTRFPGQLTALITPPAEAALDAQRLVSGSRGAR